MVASVLTIFGIAFARFIVANAIYDKARVLNNLFSGQQKPKILMELTNKRDRIGLLVLGMTGD